MDINQLIDVGELPYGKKKDRTKYLHQPPVIKPNLGRRRKHEFHPKTHVVKVLLYDNTMARKSLDIRTGFFTRQQRNVRFMYEKTRHAFADQVRLKQRLHDVWDVRYRDMKDAYVSEFGTRYMPTSDNDADEYKVFAYANLAPPINVLCYFLATGNDPRHVAMEKKRHTMKKLESMTKDPLYEYLNRRGHPVKNLPKDENQTKVCSEDQRFKSLSDSLTYPGFQSDGYLQLSPGYVKETMVPRKRRPTGQRRYIELPKFYTKHKAKREGSQCSKHSCAQENSSTPVTIYDDDRSSVSSLT